VSRPAELAERHVGRQPDAVFELSHDSRWQPVRGQRQVLDPARRPVHREVLRQPGICRGAVGVVFAQDEVTVARWDAPRTVQVAQFSARLRRSANCRPLAASSTATRQASSLWWGNGNSVCIVSSFGAVEAEPSRVPWYSTAGRGDALTPLGVATGGAGGGDGRPSGAPRERSGAKRSEASWRVCESAHPEVCSLACSQVVLDRRESCSISCSMLPNCRPRARADVPRTRAPLASTLTGKSSQVRRTSRCRKVQCLQ